MLLLAFGCPTGVHAGALFVRSLISNSNQDVMSGDCTLIVFPKSCPDVSGYRMEKYVLNGLMNQVFVAC